MTLRTRTTAGRASIDGLVVCSAITLTESWDERYITVPGADGAKDTSVGLPSTVTFDDDIEPDLHRRLAAIVAANSARDIEAARRLRDSGGSAVGLDLDLDDGRHLATCSVSSPINPYGAIHTLQFTIGHT